MSTRIIIAGLLVAWLSGSAAAQDGAFSRRATATAQLLAGIAPPAGDPVIDRLAALDSWKEHRLWMEAQWSQVRARLSEMERWRAQEVRMREGQSKTLLYPFSGPDFLNA